MQIEELDGTIYRNSIFESIRRKLVEESSVKESGLSPSSHASLHEHE